MPCWTKGTDQSWSACKKAGALGFSSIFASSLLGDVKNDEEECPMAYFLCNGGIELVLGSIALIIVTVKTGREEKRLRKTSEVKF